MSTMLRCHHVNHGDHHGDHVTTVTRHRWKRATKGEQGPLGPMGPYGAPWSGPHGPGWLQLIATQGQQIPVWGQKYCLDTKYWFECAKSSLFLDKNTV